MAPEVAAERGVVVGQPYTPPGRTGTFDVPSYDDIADLQVLFKRFANTAASYTEAGGGPFVDKTDDFTVNSQGLYVTYLCLKATLLTITVPDPSTLADGARFNVIQGSTGKAQISGPNVVGLATTAGQYQGVTATVHDGKWWCVPFGSSGGGATGPIPVFPLAADATLNAAQAGGMLAMDASTKNLKVTVPLDNGSIPVGSAYVVAHVGKSATMKVTVVGASGVTVQDRANAVVSRWRSLAIVKRDANVWLINAGSGGDESGTVPTPPELLTATPGASSAQVTWKVPADDGGYSISSYVVEKSLDNKTWNVATNFDGSTTAGLVTGLQDSVVNHLRLRAVNVKGQSDPSNLLDVTPKTLDAPIVEHTGAGQWTIKNHDSAFAYSTSTTSGSSSVSGNVVTCTGPNSVTTLTVSFAGGTPKSVYMERKAPTCTGRVAEEYKSGCANCGGCCPGGWNCEDYGAQGVWCKRYECVPDPVPPGYQAGFGEWFRSFYPSQADYSDGDGVSDKTVDERDGELRADPNAPDEVLLRELADE
jgi:hypothetical protein